MKKFFIKIIYIISCILLINIILHFCLNNIEFVEHIYSENIYLKIASILSCFFGVFPFSTGEICIVALFIVIIIKLVLILKDFSIKKLINYILNICILVFTLQLIFWCFWGINNYRYPLDKLARLEISPSSTNELKEVCNYLTEKTNELRFHMPEDELGVTFIPGSYEYVFDYSELAYSYSSEIYDFIPEGYFSKPKPMFASEIMCKLNYTGIYNPFSNEANINIKEPEFKLPFTVCHEMAHQRGFARENEANFISFLTCINSNDKYFEYSGYVSALVYCTNALYSDNKNMYRDVRENFSDGLLTDLNYLSTFWSQYKGKTAEIGKKNNDRFLKSTNQPEGVKSYGLVVDLIISYYKDKNVI